MLEKKENPEGKTVNPEQKSVEEKKPEQKSVEVFKYSGFDSEEEAREWMEDMAKRFREIDRAWLQWKEDFDNYLDKLFKFFFGE